MRAIFMPLKERGKALWAESQKAPSWDMIDMLIRLKTAIGWRGGQPEKPLLPVGGRAR